MGSAGESTGMKASGSETDPIIYVGAGQSACLQSQHSGAETGEHPPTEAQPGGKRQQRPVSERKAGQL